MESQLETAKKLEKDGDIVGALELYRRIYSENAADENAVLGIAQCALALDNLEHAFEFFVKLLILNHDNPWGYLGRACVLFRYDQQDRAFSDLARAIRLDNPPSSLRIDCAAVLNANGYTDVALDVLTPIRRNYFEDSDFRCEWCFALLVENKLNHADLPIILQNFELHAAEDPFYQLCILAFAFKSGKIADIEKFLTEYPELQSEAAQLQLIPEPTT